MSSKKRATDTPKEKTVGSGRKESNEQQRTEQQKVGKNGLPVLELTLSESGEVIHVNQQVDVVPFPLQNTTFELKRLSNGQEFTSVVKELRFKARWRQLCLDFGLEDMESTTVSSGNKKRKNERNESKAGSSSESCKCKKMKGSGI